MFLCTDGRRFYAPRRSREGSLFLITINRMMLSQELRALWTWNEKEDTTKHCEHYSTIKSRTAATQVRLERSLIWKPLRLKLFILLSVFSGTAINWLNSILPLRFLCGWRQVWTWKQVWRWRQTWTCRQIWIWKKIWSGVKLNELFHPQCITRFYSYSTRDIEHVYRYK